MRTSYLTAIPDILPTYALLLDAIRRGLTTRKHRRLLRASALSAQLKKLEDGTYPSSPRPSDWRAYSF